MRIRLPVFTVLCLDLSPGEEVVFYSITSSEEKLRNFKKYVMANGILDKREENRRIIEDIEEFLDNVMRSGMLQDRVK